VAAITVWLVRLPWKGVFKLSGATLGGPGATMAYILVQVAADDAAAMAGWGETVPVPYWTYETAESILSSIQHYLGPALLGHEVHDL